MKYANTYRFRLIPPDLKIDSRKEKNEWKEFVEYIDNCKRVSNNTTENEKIKKKDSEMDWWNEDNNVDINEPINDVLKVQKWSRLIEDDNSEYEENERDIYDNKEKKKNRKQLVLENDTSSYNDYEPEEKHFNIINYNLEKNNIYSNSTYAKNAATQKKQYSNFPPTPRSYKNKENLEKNGNNILTKNKQYSKNKDSVSDYENERAENLYKQQYAHKTNVEEQKTFSMNVNKQQTVFNLDGVGNDIKNKKVDLTSKQMRSDCYNIDDANSIDNMFDLYNKKKQRKYAGASEDMGYHAFDEDIQNEKNKNKCANSEHARSKKLSQHPIIPPFVSPRKIDPNDDLHKHKENSKNWGLTNKNIESEASENSTNDSMQKGSQNKLAGSDKDKYICSYNNIKNINKRKRENMEKKSQKKGSHKQTTKNNLKKKDYSITKKSSNTSRQKKWKKCDKTKIEIDGSYAYNYAYLDSSSNEETSCMSNDTDNSENSVNMLTSLQEKIAKYSLQKFG